MYHDQKKRCIRVTKELKKYNKRIKRIKTIKAFTLKAKQKRMYQSSFKIKTKELRK